MQADLRALITETLTELQPLITTGKASADTVDLFAGLAELLSKAEPTSEWHDKLNRLEVTVQSLDKAVAQLKTRQTFAELG